jgi:hypothetical protein
MCFIEPSAFTILGGMSPNNLTGGNADWRPPLFMLPISLHDLREVVKGFFELRLAQVESLRALKYYIIG